AISSPPARNLSAISGAQTIVRDGSDIWFTEFGSNGVGLARFSSSPPFVLVPASDQNATIARGGTAVLSFKLQGASSSPFHLQFSDSETLTSVPSNLTASSSVENFSSSNRAARFNITLRAADSLLPGNYVFDVTVTDGRASYTVFLRVDVV
ncbi:MAG: hypothetical protein OK404_02640, partial [Thaumarchaeota archaeon]|nr:hypothetical protein [Nitrososphaerota archaeon]